MPVYKVTHGTFCDKNGVLHGRGSKVEMPPAVAEYYGFPTHEEYMRRLNPPEEEEEEEVLEEEPVVEEEPEPLDEEVDPAECPEKRRHGVYARMGDACPECGYSKDE